MIVIVIGTCRVCGGFGVLFLFDFCLFVVRHDKTRGDVLVPVSLYVCWCCVCVDLPLLPRVALSTPW